MARAYAYDTKNCLTNLGVTGAAGNVAGYSYLLDPSGHRLSVTELSGRTVNYGPDNLYRLTSETIANDAAGNNGTIGYQYDKAGNRLQQTGPHKLSSWRWRQKRFTRRLDKMLLDQVGTEELAKMLRPMVQTWTVGSEPANDLRLR